MRTWLIVVLVLTAVAVITLVIVLPIVLIGNGGGEPTTPPATASNGSGMVVTINVIDGKPLTFDSTLDPGVEPIHYFEVRVTQDGLPAVNVPLSFQPEIMGNASIGTIGDVVDYPAIAALELGQPLCQLTDDDGALTYSWAPMGRNIRDNQGSRAWFERHTWTAYPGGSCSMPSGTPASAVIDLTPLPAIAPTTMYVESAVIKRNENRIILTIRSLGTPFQQVTLVPGVPILDFNRDPGITIDAVFSTIFSLAPSNTNVVYVDFGPGELDDPMRYPGANLPLSAPLEYGTVAPNTGIQNVATGDFLPVHVFPAILGG